MKLRKADIKVVLNNDKVFKDVVGYEGLYKISYNGYVYSYVTNKLLKPGLSNGYYSVALVGKRTHYVHRLVGEAWIPNPENKKCINHKTGNKKFNHKDWLEWNTHGENNSHAIQTGLKKPIIEAKGVIQKDLDGNVVSTYRTTVEAEAFGFRSGNIALCCNGKP